MNVIMVEPITKQLAAYHFDGRRESAIQAIDKWDCVMSSLNDQSYKITFKDATEVMPGDYIVIEDNKKLIYKQDDFVRTYKIVYDNRNRLGNFYSID